MTDQKKEVVDLNKPQPKKIIGLDCGTMNIVLAQKSDDKNVSISSIRNMYLPLDKNQVTMAEMSNIDYVESDDNMFITGDDSFRFANIFNQQVKRPMSKGLISPNEVDGVDVLALIIKKLIGTTKDGYCLYSVPAQSVDVQNNITYHEGVFKRILTSLGYQAESFNEAMAIIYSQCQEDQFSGLAFSFGAGQVNVSLAFKSVPVIMFSVARSGDWIDEQTAMSLGTVPNRVTSIKEKDMDLLNYSVGSKKEKRVREAIVYYYKEMIRYSLDQIKKKMMESTDNLDLPESLNIIVSGGTSLVKGFVPLFKEIIFDYKDDLPFEIKDVKHADDPLSAVAEGLLIKALTKFSK